MIQFVFYLLFEVDNDNSTIFAHHGFESVGLHVDDKGAAAQVFEFALQPLVLPHESFVLGLQTDT